MNVDVDSEYLLSKVPPCPDWCRDKHDHDVDQLAKGERSRIHFSNALERSSSVLFDDNPSSPTPWSFETPEVELVGKTAGELASEIREHGNDLRRTAEWLERIEEAGQ